MGEMHTFVCESIKLKNIWTCLRYAVKVCVKMQYYTNNSFFGDLSELKKTDGNDA